MQTMDDARKPADWQVNELRLTAFSLPGARMDLQSWWADVVGRDPETEVKKAALGLHQLEGRALGGNLLLRSTSNRIDWLLYVVGSPEPESLPVVGPYISVLAEFSSLAKAWIHVENRPSLERLALGAKLLQQVVDRESGYRLLSTFLPAVRIDPVGSSDLRYSINRRRKSVSYSSEMWINRLNTWSVSRITSVAVGLGPSAAPLLSQTEPAYACCLELDVNTVPEHRGELPCESVLLLLDELVGLATEIATKGDIA